MVRKRTGLNQVKLLPAGWRQRQKSTIQQERKSWAKGLELFRDVSATHEPDLSKFRSKTVLKSPQTKVGVAGSTVSATLSKKRFLAGFRLGAWRHTISKEELFSEKEQRRRWPSLSAKDDIS